MVHGDARDESVVGNGVAQYLCYRPHLLRFIAGWIDDGVEGPAAKRRKISIAVAAQSLDLGKEVRVLLAPVEEDDLVPPCKRGFDNVPTEEERSAEN